MGITSLDTLTVSASNNQGITISGGYTSGPAGAAPALAFALNGGLYSYIGTAVSGGNWNNNASPGDTVMRTEVASNKPIFCNGTSGATLVLNNNNVGIGTATPGSNKLQVVGNFTATTKSFTIDHPSDPANKYLVHACIESDEYKNIYDGVATTDALGYATVNLPSWFDDLNENFRYQLTVVDTTDYAAFVQAKIVERVRDNRFVIRTSGPNVEVSWQITGNRKDAYVKAHPRQVERAKVGAERGKFLHPEVFGASPDAAIGNLPVDAAAAAATSRN